MRTRWVAIILATATVVASCTSTTDEALVGESPTAPGTASEAWCRTYLALNEFTGDADGEERAEAEALFADLVAETLVPDRAEVAPAIIDGFADLALERLLAELTGDEVALRVGLTPRSDTEPEPELSDDAALERADAWVVDRCPIATETLSLQPPVSN